MIYIYIYINYTVIGSLYIFYTPKIKEENNLKTKKYIIHRQAKKVYHFIHTLYIYRKYSLYSLSNSNNKVNIRKIVVRKK